MKSEDIARYVGGLEAEVDRLHAAQPVLPDVGPVTRGSGETEGGFWVDGVHFGEWPGRSYLREAARYFAVAAFLDAETAAADTTPDTSRVTFGTRHEGTGMVLLQHADFSSWWGESSVETAEYHLGPGGQRAAHEELAEVREALNTAEAAGVDVEDEWYIHCGIFETSPDDSNHKPYIRAGRYLAREVQALVAQGLRGDDLNARVPYAVRDHRAPVEAAESSGDDGPDADELLAARLKDEYLNGPDIGRWVRVAQLARSEFRRAARTSEEQNRG